MTIYIIKNFQIKSFCSKTNPMKTFFLLSLLTFVYCEQNIDPSRVWNVLSLDGGGIRGLITAKVVDYMESESYRYARE